MPFRGDYLYVLRYAEFTVPLVKAVQELDNKNKELQLTNEYLKAKVDQLETDMERIKGILELQSKK